MELLLDKVDLDGVFGLEWTGDVDEEVCADSPVIVDLPVAAFSLISSQISSFVKHFLSWHSSSFI